MWICSKRGFFSIVQSTFDRNEFLVRARDIEHLRALEPDVPILTTPDRDYPYRITVCRARLSELIAMLAGEIDYGNFKAQVDATLGWKNWYAAALHDVWHVFWREAGHLRPGGEEPLMLDIGEG